MTPAAAIRAATLDAATLLGQEARIGSLAPGKDADIIAVGASPLEDVTRLENVGLRHAPGRRAQDRRPAPGVPGATLRAPDRRSSSSLRILGAGRNGQRTDSAALAHLYLGNFRDEKSLRDRTPAGEVA